MKQFESRITAARVLCTTSALGLGVNLRRVDFVIHFQMPASITSFYQEAGRCGRDGATGRSLVLYHASDMHRLLAGCSGSTTQVRPAPPYPCSINRAQLKALHDMQRYCVTKHCRRAVILRSLQSRPVQACAGRCDNCPDLAPAAHSGVIDLSGN